MVNPSGAKGFVIGATAGAAILASLDDLAAARPPDIKIAIGGVIAAAFLYALADAAPELAIGFAAILLVGAILTNGAQVAAIISKATT
jgi:hypothetical protein